MESPAWPLSPCVTGVHPLEGTVVQWTEGVGRVSSLLSGIREVPCPSSASVSPLPNDWSFETCWWCAEQLDVIKPLKESNHILALGNQDQTRCLRAPLCETELWKIKRLFLYYSVVFSLFGVLLSPAASYNILLGGLKENNPSFKRPCANFTGLHGCGIQRGRSGRSPFSFGFLRRKTSERTRIAWPTQSGVLGSGTPFRSGD